MKKRNRIIYWIATAWLSLGMLSSAIVQLIPLPEEAAVFNALGYPQYLMALLGFWKILGVIVLLLPKLPLLKEWAYAGFFFTMSGAAYSHIAAADPFTQVAPTLFLLFLTFTSWYLRPAGRTLRLHNAVNDTP